MILKELFPQWMAVFFALLLVSTPSFSESESRAIKDGSYITPMYLSANSIDKSKMGDGKGGAIAFGYKTGFFAFEIVPSLVEFDDVDLPSIALNGLIFPLEKNDILNGYLKGIYLSAGISASNYQDYPVVTPEGEDDREDFSTIDFGFGLGYIFPLTLLDIDFSLRAEAYYRKGKREREFNDTDTDLNAPMHFEQTVFSFGIQIPLGS